MSQVSVSAFVHVHAKLLSEALNASDVCFLLPLLRIPLVEVTPQLQTVFCPVIRLLSQNHFTDSAAICYFSSSTNRAVKLVLYI